MIYTATIAIECFKGIVMGISCRVCVVMGIVLLATSCAMTNVTLPALDTSKTTEAEVLEVYTGAAHMRGINSTATQVIQGRGEGAARAMGGYMKGSMQAGGVGILTILLAPVLLPTAGVIGASMAHSKDEVAAAANAFMSVGRDTELLTSIDRRFVEALGTDTTTQWACIQVESMTPEETCSEVNLTARLELRPVFILTMKGEYDPDIVIVANVEAFTTIENAVWKSRRLVDSAKWMYREELGDYFQLAKDNAALLRGKIKRILDLFADKMVDDLFRAPQSVIVVLKRDLFGRITAPEIPEGVVVRVR